MWRRRYGSRFRNSGYSINVASLAPGRYVLVPFAHPTVGGFVQTQSVVVEVQLRPHGAIDSPGPDSVIGPWFTVTGWAIESGASSGTGVDGVYIWAYPSGGGAGIPLGWADYGKTRQDVAGRYGSRFLNSGYSLATGIVNSSGSYTIVAYVHDALAGGFHQQQAVTVRKQQDPRGAIDPPAGGFAVSPSFTLTGWAIDANNQLPGPGVDGVYLWAFPVSGEPPFAVNSSAAYGLARSDVESQYGPFFRNSGYSVTVWNLPAGVYVLVPFVHESPGGFFRTQSAVVTVR